VKVGTKVQLKITAIDHDHGFKIGSVPDGSSSADKSGLIFTSEQECWHKGVKGQIVVELYGQCDARAVRSGATRPLCNQILP
jgi:hypothetical protein